MLPVSIFVNFQLASKARTQRLNSRALVLSETQIFSLSIENHFDSAVAANVNSKEKEKIARTKHVCEVHRKRNISFTKARDWDVKKHRRGANACYASIGCAYFRQQV